jgi:hypothetical protein
MEKLPDGYVTKFIVGSIGLLVALSGYLLIDSYQHIRSKVDSVEKDLAKIDRRTEAIYEEALRNRVTIEKLQDTQRERGERLARIEIRLDKLEEMGKRR